MKAEIRKEIDKIINEAIKVIDNQPTDINSGKIKNIKIQVDVFPGNFSGFDEIPENETFEWNF